MKLRYYLASVMLALVLTACKTTRTNAPQKVRNNAIYAACETVRQCDNG